MCAVLLVFSLIAFLSTSCQCSCFPKLFKLALVFPIAPSVETLLICHTVRFICCYLRNIWGSPASWLLLSALLILGGVKCHHGSRSRSHTKGRLRKCHRTLRLPNPSSSTLSSLLLAHNQSCWVLPYSYSISLAQMSRYVCVFLWSFKKYIYLEDILQKFL